MCRLYQSLRTASDKFVSFILRIFCLRKINVRFIPAKTSSLQRSINYCATVIDYLNCQNLCNPVISLEPFSGNESKSIPLKLSLNFLFNPPTVLQLNFLIRYSIVFLVFVGRCGSICLFRFSSAQL